MDNRARRELYCLVENEDKPFKVIAVVDNDVADLKILVQQAKKNGTLRDADATDLVLFKVITVIHRDQRQCRSSCILDSFTNQSTSTPLTPSTNVYHRNLAISSHNMLMS